MISPTVPFSAPTTPSATALPEVSPEVLELAVREATTPLEYSELVVGKQYPAVVGKPGAKNTMLKLPQMTRFTFLGVTIQYKGDGERTRDHHYRQAPCYGGRTDSEWCTLLPARGLVLLARDMGLRQRGRRPGLPTPG